MISVISMSKIPLLFLGIRLPLVDFLMLQIFSYIAIYIFSPKSHVIFTYKLFININISMFGNYFLNYNEMFFFFLFFFNCMCFCHWRKKVNFFVAASEDEGTSSLPSVDPSEKSSPFSYFFRPQGVSHQTLMPVSSSLNTCLMQLMVSFNFYSFIKINHFVFSSF